MGEQRREEADAGGERNAGAIGRAHRQIRKQIRALKKQEREQVRMVRWYLKPACVDHDLYQRAAPHLTWAAHFRAKWMALDALLGDGVRVVVHGPSRKGRRHA